MSGGHGNEHGASHGKKKQTVAGEILEEIADDVGPEPKSMSTEDRLERYGTLARPGSTVSELVKKRARDFFRGTPDQEGALMAAQREVENAYKGMDNKAGLKDRVSVRKMVNTYMDKVLVSAYINIDELLKQEIDEAKKSKGGALTADEIFDLKMGLFNRLVGYGKNDKIPNMEGVFKTLYGKTKLQALNILNQVTEAYEEGLAGEVIEKVASKYIKDEDKDDVLKLVRKRLAKTNYEPTGTLLDKNVGTLASLYVDLVHDSVSLQKYNFLRSKKDTTGAKYGKLEEKAA